MFLRHKICLLTIVMLTACVCSGCGTGTLRRDEVVTFFPSAAYRAPDGSGWVLPIRGWIYKPEHDSLKRHGVLGVVDELIELGNSRPETGVVVRRARPFMVQDRSGRSISIRLAGQEHVVGASNNDGHFETILTLDQAAVDTLQQDGLIRYQAVTSPADPRTFEGQLILLEPNGKSVISDIDDTIKITDVSDFLEAAKRTFFEEFKPVPGMPQLYQQWQRAGAKFHYVSASPWQLFLELAGFLQENGFPPGSAHLSHLSLKRIDSYMSEDSQAKGKLTSIEELFETFPRRRFVMVGDSTQRDPETYGEIARRYPAQVAAIFIRGVEGTEDHAQRYEAAFSDVPRSLWRVFHDPSEIQGRNPFD